MLPDPALMELYGTLHVFLEKEAGELSLLDRLGVGGINAAVARELLLVQKEEEARKALQAEMELAAERVRLSQATDNLRHTDPNQGSPGVVRRGFDMNQLQPYMDEGTVRLASIAAQTGVDLAKEAGIGGDIFSAAKGVASAGLTAANAGRKSVGLTNTRLLLGGGAVAGLYGTHKMLGAGQRVLSGEPTQVPTYGGQVMGVGSNIPASVNQYGVPQW